MIGGKMRQLKICFMPVIMSFIFVFICLSSTYARVVKQLMPTLTISEEYSDNYLQTDTNKTEEYITSIELGVSLGFLEKNHQLYFNYNPMYKKYDKLDQNDGLDHNIGMDGTWMPSKRSSILYGIDYTKTDADRIGESVQSTGDFRWDYSLTKNTTMFFSENYSQHFDQQATTGNWREYDISNTSAGFKNQFGENNFWGLNYTFSFTEYDESSSDDFTSHKPEAYFGYWFTPLYGIDSNLSFETIDYDLSSTQDKDTYAGDIRLLRKINRHFNVYVKYRQTYTEQSLGDHETYHPSVGVDWKPTEDTGINLGAGVIFREYDDQTNYTKEQVFIDLDVYKIFNFSPRGTLSLTGSSGYGEVDEEAASLGFNIYYQAGATFTYQLTKHLSSDMSASYKIDEFDDPTTNDRTDKTLSFRSGLSWIALKWLRFNLSYEYNDFDTNDSSGRNDYQENKVTFTVNFIPTQPVRMETSPSRSSLEDTLFN